MENIKGMICDMEGIEGRSIMPVSRFYGFKMGGGVGKDIFKEIKKVNFPKWKKNEGSQIERNKKKIQTDFKKRSLTRSIISEI